MKAQTTGELFLVLYLNYFFWVHSEYVGNMEN